MYKGNFATGQPFSVNLCKFRFKKRR
uniref:Uncharacterized protein n=1 Tax=Arundo donax TaxID=35708 RepID=A0A0A8ZQJ5_ARUDO